MAIVINTTTTHPDQVNWEAFYWNEFSFYRWGKEV